MTSKLTTELHSGDRVYVNDHHIVRTVSHLTHSGYVNARNQPLLTVHWTEGNTSEWSRGNTVNANYEWILEDSPAPVDVTASLIDLALVVRALAREHGGPSCGTSKHRASEVHEAWVRTIALSEVSP